MLAARRTCHDLLESTSHLKCWFLQSAGTTVCSSCRSFPGAPARLSTFLACTGCCGCSCTLCRSGDGFKNESKSTNRCLHYYPRERLRAQKWYGTLIRGCAVYCATDSSTVIMHLPPYRLRPHCCMGASVLHVTTRQRRRDAQVLVLLMTSACSPKQQQPAAVKSGEGAAPEDARCLLRRTLLATLQLQEEAHGLSLIHI